MATFLLNSIISASAYNFTCLLPTVNGMKCLDNTVSTPLVCPSGEYFNDCYNIEWRSGGDNHKFQLCPKGKICSIIIAILHLLLPVVTITGDGQYCSKNLGLTVCPNPAIAKTQQIKLCLEDQNGNEDCIGDDNKGYLK